ncbi:hypothetical protein V502_02144 [Pseudogymnoascus sp. VKM F-4520 (FW-2644)]|nr:hypothetical protein V502_02144 [Pseudogymnoascus sp. VKM F-4520 (FW-2644)]
MADRAKYGKGFFMKEESCAKVVITSESTMLAPSSPVLNTSDQNYQAMPTTEPLDTASIVDVPADLSTPFD